VRPRRNVVRSRSHDGTLRIRTVRRSEHIRPPPARNRIPFSCLFLQRVGSVGGSDRRSARRRHIPSNHVTVTFNLPRAAAKLYGLAAGWRFPAWMKRRAQKELGGFIELLRLQEVKVRQPDIVDFSPSYSTPWWSSRGFCVACPRDSFLVIGDEIIKTPMCWRSRYFEAIAYVRCSRSTSVRALVGPLPRGPCSRTSSRITTIEFPNRARRCAIP
jgi:hypothetical protein